MSVQTSSKDANQKGNVRYPVIDVDVHEMLHSPKDLLPYLKQPWRHYVADCGWQGTRQLPFVQLMETGVDRSDSKPSTGGPAGSDYDLLKSQLLDEYDIKYAVLTGLFYPSTMKSQFEFATALATAYNKWEIENWLEKDERFLGTIHVAAQDPRSAAMEIERASEHPRMVQVMLPIGTLQYGDPFFDPIFAAAEKHNLHIVMHQSTATPTCLGTPRYFIEWHSTMQQAFMSEMASLILNGVFDRHPRLKVVMLEGGFTWVPHMMWRLDLNYRSLRREVPWVKRLPSEYIKEHFYFATQPMEDPNPKYLNYVLEMMETEKSLLFATDYPHWDFDSPLRALPYTFSAELKQRILYDNARELYGL